MLAGNDFVHGVTDRLKALELLNLANNSGLIGVDDNASFVGVIKKAKEANSRGEPNGRGNEGHG